ncbi:LPS-assembly protein LptD [Actimicrobium sp. CCI2.3]|uniref:LPS-assembly protein LptD n=1 Tax=Actimicrobium sp. CCI2.3 TaxID=3048616 RepID=UPI002AB3F0A6|nr:LPS-assembly protein LptD [Actimicrobium sp. CCI2.3]MDY7573766.1 LPS-assembly protein LptD [Actimicrobium sp. CCI2.3]MEB0022377.1 LPS-assembly protein LptD [Actimicrobium sp. CCI2.3]
MIRFPVLSPTQRLLRTLTAVVAAAALPSYVLAQSASKPVKQSDREAPAEISAESMTGRPDRELDLANKVEIVRGVTTINSDKAQYHVVEDEVEAIGNVRMKRVEDIYTGDELKLNMDGGIGYVTNPTYRLERTKGQGAGKRIDFESETEATVVDGTYSTCEGPNPDWYLRSGTLNLDTARDIGLARNSVVYFKGVPILGAPAMSFPLSGARKSGVLPPTIGATNRGGLEVMVPYYFNIAPNRDLTVYPNVIAQRGLQLGAVARYLDPSYSGETKLEGLLKDKLTGTDRWSVSSIHTQSLLPGLTLNWNINAASDDAYPSDFSRTLTTAQQRLLLRDLSLSYGQPYWSLTARASKYQVLQDPLAPIAQPYDRLPQITFSSARPDIGGFDLALDSDLTRFAHPTLQQGDRLFVSPKVSYPIIEPGFFITPKLSFHATRYQLADGGAGVAPGTDTSLQRTIPTASIDSGMVFERESNFFGHGMTQTLEPRLFYVYTPYRDQSMLPNFDSGLADLSFTQLFSENRFVGNDRIGDANQVTAAVTTRFLEETGAERARIALGQRYYFADQRVALGTLPNQSRSDLLLSANGRVSQSFSAETNLQYSQSQGVLNRANAGIKYQPGPMKVLNLAYRQDLPNNLEKSFEVSTQWPFASRWYGVGRINYSLTTSKVAEGLLGVEYKADCWVFRVVAQRIPTATLQATSALFFQLELNGLSKLGSNPLQALRSSVPGYQNVNQPYNRQ